MVFAMDSGNLHGLEPLGLVEFLLKLVHDDFVGDFYLTIGLRMLYL